MIILLNKTKKVGMKINDHYYSGQILKMMNL